MIEHREYPSDLIARLPSMPLAALMAEASALAEKGHGRLVSYSRKVFIPLTKLCRDVCHYCTFAERPRQGHPAYLSPDDVLAIARAGAAAGCHEALFTLGDKPELRYAAAAEALRAMGQTSTLTYLADMCALVMRETGLLPHINPGVMTEADIVRAAPGLGLDGADAGERVRAALGARRGSSRLARQGPPTPARDDAAGGREAGPLHHRHPHRHRRDARGAPRGAPRYRRSPPALRPYPGSHHPEFPRQAGDAPRRRGGADARRAALDHRRRAAASRAGDEYPGAAQSLARRLSPPDRRRHQRLGRHLAGDPRSRQPGSALADDPGAPPSHRRARENPRGAPRGLSPLCARRRALGRRQTRAAAAAAERRRRLRPHRGVGAGIAASVGGRRAGAVGGRSRDRGDRPGGRTRHAPRRGADRPPLCRARHRFSLCRRSRGRAAARGERRSRALRRQPQHQLHQYLQLPLPVLRLLQGQDGGDAARRAL